MNCSPPLAELRWTLQASALLTLGWLLGCYFHIGGAHRWASACYLHPLPASLNNGRCFLHIADLGVIIRVAGDES